MYEIVKNYRDNEKLRKSFNELAEKTFGLSFEDWYQNGFWREHYIPYSMTEDGKVLANVSVNRMDMNWNGKKYSLIQLGTVMTAEEHRNRGLIRRLMEEIEKDYEGQWDGMYLFANDSVLDFYPRFGFRPEREFQYYKEVRHSADTQDQQKRDAWAKQIPMKTKEQWASLETAIKNSRPHSAFEMWENRGLYLFYVSKFMQENVYYIEKLDTYVIGELEEGDLFLHDYFSEREITLEQVAEAFGDSVKKVTLGFTPLDPTGFERQVLREEDTTLFVKGEVFEKFRDETLMFQTLSHA